MRKNIAVVTGTRAEYGILVPVFKAIEDDKRLKLSLVVTGTHLSHEFGYTVQEIEKDSFKIAARVPMLPAGDTPAAMAESVGQGIIGMVGAWQQLKPDIILVLGDRTEPLAAAISGAYMNIPVAHIHGGDNPRAGLDEYARHAITKFANIHFPATKKSAARIIKMGEDKWRVHMVGSPAVDAIIETPPVSAAALGKKLGLDLSRPFILLTQHPVTTQVDDAAAQIKETLEAVVAAGCLTIITYPNSDAGGRKMIGVIKKYEKYPFIKTYPSLPHHDFLNLMKMAAVMVGNSSSGITEAPSMGLPAVNIGIRQEGRERGANVIDCAHKKSEIARAIKKALTDNEFLAEVKKCRSPYGDGHAAPRIAEVLSQVEMTPALLQKRITY